MTTQEILKASSKELKARYATLKIFFNSKNYKDFKYKIIQEAQSINEELINRGDLYKN